MNREEAYSRIDAIIAKHEIDDEYVTITSILDYDALRFARKLLEQEHCEDEYIKVPKKALKYRTAGMVAYNAEWLKNNFDIERAVICGAQQPCDDAIRISTRQKGTTRNERVDKVRQMQQANQS